MSQVSSCCSHALIALFICTAALAQVGPEQTPDFVPGQLIVGLKDADTSILNDFRDNRFGSAIIPKRLRTRSAGLIDQGVVKIDFEIRSMDEGLSKAGQLALLRRYARAIKEDARVAFAHPNWIVTLSARRSFRRVALESVPAKPSLRITTQSVGPSDPVFQRGLHWHYLPPPIGMNAIDAWKITHGSGKIVVAVLDTGIIPNQPDIALQNLIPGFDFISRDPTDGDGVAGRDGNPTDPGDACELLGQPNSWHGTHVAGTIGAAGTDNKIGIAAVSWSVSVLPVRVIGHCGGTIEDASAAIRWASGLPVMGVKQTKAVDIINISWGLALPCSGVDTGLLAKAVSDARQAGVIVVSSASNEGIDIAGVAPASCDGVIAVAAADRRGHLAPYSNYGAVSIMAPGGDLNRDDDKDGAPDGVWSLIAPSVTEPAGVAAYDGTSMAAPHVTAALAMALGVSRYFSTHRPRTAEFLAKSATRISSGECAHPCGPGHLDAKALLLLVQSVDK